MTMTHIDLARQATKPLPQRVCRFLAEEGFRPKLALDAPAGPQITFKLEGRTFVVLFDERDDAFVQVCAAVVLDGTSRDELTHLRVAQPIQFDAKVLKVFVSPNLEFVEFQMELVLPVSGMTSDLLDRCTRTILSAWSNYFERVRHPMPYAEA